MFETRDYHVCPVCGSQLYHCKLGGKKGEYFASRILNKGLCAGNMWMTHGLTFFPFFLNKLISRRFFVISYPGGEKNRHPVWKMKKVKRKK